MELAAVLGQDPAHVLDGKYQPYEKASNRLASYRWPIRLLEVLCSFVRAPKNRYPDDFYSEWNEQIVSQVQARFRSDPDSGSAVTVDDIETLLIARNALEIEDREKRK